MASRILTQQRVRPIATAAILTGLALYPRSIAQAEVPEELSRRKPIYDDLPPKRISQTLQNSSSLNNTTSSTSSSPTPTDRLAKEIKKSRIFLHTHLDAAETKLNELLTSLLHLEANFTHTIASLAPPPSSGEKLLPGALYVLVAGMTGSIITRNRNILLRASVPLAMGIGAGWLVTPMTMRNVADLAWNYERRFPRLAEGHTQARERIMRAWSTAKEHSSMTMGVVEDKVAEARDAVEGWVRKGR